MAAFWPKNPGRDFDMRTMYWKKPRSQGALHLRIARYANVLIAREFGHDSGRSNGIQAAWKQSSSLDYDDYLTVWAWYSGK